MRKLLPLLLLLAIPAFGQGNVADPCQNASVVKSSVSIAVGSATTTQLVALYGGQSVYVCGFTLTAAVGTAATYQFEYGTGTTCGTGTTALTGAMIGGGVILTGGPGTQFKTPSGNALCLVTGGTGPSAQGYLTYVQQ